MKLIGTAAHWQDLRWNRCLPWCAASWLTAASHSFRNDFRDRHLASTQLASDLLTRGKKLIPCPWIAPGCPTLCGISLSVELWMTSSKKKKESGRFPDKFCTAQFPSRCHARTKHCIVFSGSSAHVHLNLFVSSYDLLIPARIRKGRHTCSTSEAPCIGPTVYFI